jgi:hypothetical protein
MYWMKTPSEQTLIEEVVVIVDAKACILQYNIELRRQRCEYPLKNVIGSINHLKLIMMESCKLQTFMELCVF